MRAQTGCARADMRAPTAPAIEGKIDFQIEIVPADGTGTAKGSKRRLRYVAVFEQLSGKSLLTPIQSCGVPGSKHNGPSKIKSRLSTLQACGMTGIKSPTVPMGPDATFNLTITLQKVRKL
jgi:hypothetical protein